MLPQIISSELVKGPNRFVFSFLDASGTKPVGSPDRTATVQFKGPGGESVAAPAAEFVWAIEGVSGVYVTHADFPVAGAVDGGLHDVGAGLPGGVDPVQLRRQGRRQRRRAGREGAVGRHADAGRCRWRRLEDLDRRDPGAGVLRDLRGRRARRARAVRPRLRDAEVLRQTKTCGPTLDKIKTVATAHPDVTFINVEPYQLERRRRPAPAGPERRERSSRPCRRPMPTAS